MTNKFAQRVSVYEGDGLFATIFPNKLSITQVIDPEKFRLNGEFTEGFIWNPHFQNTFDPRIGLSGVEFEDPPYLFKKVLLSSLEIPLQEVHSMTVAGRKNGWFNPGVADPQRQPHIIDPNNQIVIGQGPLLLEIYKSSETQILVDALTLNGETLLSDFRKTKERTVYLRR